MMDKIFIIIVTISLSVACTKENFIDTGKASGIHDGSIMDYMRSDSRNWDSTVVAIEWAGLTALFDGKDQQYPEITFFGPTKLSIIRYMLDNKIEQIKDVEPEVWKKMILRYVIAGKHMKVRFGVGDAKTGGDVFTALAGNSVRVYRELHPYHNTPDAGAVTLHIQSSDTGYSVVQIASADIEPNNGAVHSLVYSFTFGKF